MRRAPLLSLLALAGTAVLTACLPPTVPPSVPLPTLEARRSPAVVQDLPAGTGSAAYVVRTVDGSDPAKVAAASGADPELVYRNAVRGFAAELGRDEIEALRDDPRVLEVLRDLPVHASDTVSPSPSWGLDRLDQRALPLSNSYTWPAPGAQVDAYVVDTGVAKGHSEFTGRVSSAYFDAMGGTGEDCNGHGTHVAGTVAGATYGVARTATVVPVRVLDCTGSGSISSVIGGIDWAVAHHGSRPAVLNMSLGGGAYSPLDAAVERAVADGITVVVAAGNESADACGTSPARAGSALTVGSTTAADARSSFSNWGTCVDLFAPGSSIKSSYIGSSSTTATLSGTSMASPHVAGAAARYLSAYPGAAPAQVSSALLAGATTGVVSSPGTGSPDRLLYASPTSEGTPPSTTTTTTPTTSTTTPTTSTTTPTSSTTTSTTVAPARPRQPGRPAVRPGNRSAEVTWAAVAAVPQVSSYTVTVRRAVAPATVVATVSVAGTRAVVPNLVNGERYVAAVAATNAAGASDTSPLSEAFVPAGVPGVPAAPTVTSRPMTLLVRWAAPAANGSAVRSYDVAIMPAGSTTALVVRGVPRTEFTVPVPPGRWTFRVRAVNAAGASEWSAASAPAAAVWPASARRR